MTLTNTQAGEGATTSAPARSGRRRPQLNSTGQIWLALVLVVIVGSIFVGMNGGNLVSGGSIFDILNRSSLLGFIAIGQTLVILCRSLDLSVGYVAALSSIVAATTMAGQENRVLLGVAAALGVSAIVGFVNGYVTVKFRVHAFITTLGTGLIIKGYLDTQYPGPSGSTAASFQTFGYTRIGIVPLSTAIMFAVAVIGILYLARSRGGYRMYAVGGNDEVARLSGIRTDRTLIAAHVLCSLAAGVAGLLLASRFGTGSGAQIYSAGYDLDSIAAVVLGGTLLLGGRGGIAGTIAGVLILGVLDSVFNQLGLNSFFRDVLRGSIIIAAVAIYARRQIDPTKSRARFDGRGDPPASRPATPPGGSAGSPADATTSRGETA